MASKEKRIGHVLNIRTVLAAVLIVQFLWTFTNAHDRGLPIDSSALAALSFVGAVILMGLSLALLLSLAGRLVRRVV